MQVGAFVTSSTDAAGLCFNGIFAVVSTKLSNMPFVSESVSPVPEIVTFDVLLTHSRFALNKIVNTVCSSTISVIEMTENFKTPSATLLSLTLKKEGVNPFSYDANSRSSVSKFKTKSPAPRREPSSSKTVTKTCSVDSKNDAPRITLGASSAYTLSKVTLTSVV